MLIIIAYFKMAINNKAKSNEQKRKRKKNKGTKLKWAIRQNIL